MRSSTTSAKPASAGNPPSSRWLTAAFQTPALCWKAQRLDNKHRLPFSSNWSPDFLWYPDHVLSVGLSAICSREAVLHGRSGKRSSGPSTRSGRHPRRGAACVLPFQQARSRVVSRHLDAVGWGCCHSASGPQRGATSPRRALCPA